MRRLFLTGLCATLIAAQAAADTQPVNRLPSDLKTLPDTIDRALSEFYTPGMSVGIVKNGKIVYLAGHGLRDKEQGLPVTPDTWFRLASVSKAFTATTVAQLVDEEKLNWHTKVEDVLPGFRMADPFASREMDITDLLTHRSGLGSGAGDSMLWPEPSGFSRQDIVHNLRFLTPQYSFRSEYAYSNVMYITAGEIVAHLTEDSWESRLQNRVFAPLGMDCFGGDVPGYVLENRAISYGHNDERGIYPIPRNQLAEKGIVSAAAGGISCNATGMLKWVQMWLDEGKSAGGETILSEDAYNTMLTPQTLLSVDDTDEEWDHMHFKAYGLGWRLMDIFGHKVISHTGTLSGYQTYVAFVPDQQLGVVVLNNGSNYGARGAVMQTILKAYLPESDKRNWIDEYRAYQDKQEEKYLARHTTPSGSGEVLLPQITYAGQFSDEWFGLMTVYPEGDTLRIKSDKMPTLTGRLEPFEDHTFVIRWDNQNAASDAFIRYQVNVKREVTGFTLYPFTEREITNHEWRDMVFTVDKE
ncbi:MAG: serine hydrolase [Alteromonadaceae bacterium]|nr:serine hydrolase [Alteromonadaceae bacterium]